jgi:hypothetical protein
MKSTASAKVSKGEARTRSKWAPTLPYAVMFDTRLSAAARVLAGALEYHGRGEPVCWPTNATLAEMVGCGADHIRKTLLPELEKYWIRRGHDPGAPGRRRKERGEVLILMWNPGALEALAQWCPGFSILDDASMGTIEQGGVYRPGGGGSTDPGGEGLQTPRSNYREETHLQPVNGGNGFLPQGGEIPEAPDTAQEPAQARDAAQVEGTIGGDPEAAQEPPEPSRSMTLEEAIAALAEPGGNKLVNGIAHRIADDLQDHGSLRFYAKVCRIVTKGETPDRLRRAYRAASAVARNPGAHPDTTPGKTFTRTWMAWIDWKDSRPTPIVTSPPEPAPRPALAVVKPEPDPETPEQKAARLKREREARDAAAEESRHRELQAKEAGRMLKAMIGGVAQAAKPPRDARRKPAPVPPPAPVAPKPTDYDRMMRDALHYLKGTELVRKRGISDLEKIVREADYDLAQEAFEELAEQGIDVKPPEPPGEQDTAQGEEPAA